MRRLPDVLDHVDDVEDHRDVHAAGGGGLFYQDELRLGAIDERHPVLDVLGVPALGFQRRLGDHIQRLPLDARPDPFGHRAGPHRPGSGLGPGPGRRLWRHQALQELLGAAHEWRRRVDGGHRRHALGVLLLSRLQTREQRQMLPVPPALLRGLARRLAQVVAMQHHTLAVEGEHDDRPLGRRPAPLGLTRLVEGVEVGSPASHQLFRLTLGYLGGGTAGQLEQRFVERTRGDRDGHPAAHLERVTLRRQVQRRV